MKRLLIALFICFAFSSVAQAGKPAISYWNNPGLDVTENGPLPGEDVGSCQYTSNELYSVFVRSRKNTELSLQVISDTETVSLYTKLIGSISNVGASYRPNFEVDAGVSWSLVWVLSSTHGKGRTLDAVEVTTGHCQ